MTTSHQPHLFSWSELMTNAPEQACEFYGRLFDWQFEAMDMPDGRYFVASNKGTQIAGIMARPDKVPVNGWGQYVTVSDVTATAQRINELGGNVLTPATTIPGVGRFIVFQDPQGAVLSAIEYETATGE